MKQAFNITLALALLASAPAMAQDSIDVMTQNQYLGADLTPVIAAPDAAAFNRAVLDVIGQIADNDLPARARALAKLIAQREPELVGLQEVFAFICEDLPEHNGFGCSHPSIAGAVNDHLALTEAALLDIGADYVVAATVQNINIQIPVDTDLDGDFNILVTIVDRDVILAHGDLAYTQVLYSDFCVRPSADGGPGCNYEIVATADDAALGPIVIERGWVGIDVTIDGKDYRFVNTHLEGKRPDGTDASSIVQALQAAELIQVLESSTPPGASLIVVGDINSSPDDPIIANPTMLSPFPQIIPPYKQFVRSGYTDAWDLRPGHQPGYTCCQLKDLSNMQSIHEERIDVIFSNDVPSSVKKPRVLGSKVSDKTPPAGLGLWPSDHGSVAAELQFE